MRHAFRSGLSAAAMLAVLLVVPEAADAQGRGKSRGGDSDRDRPELIRRGDYDRGDDRRAERGPPFCRNGQGHPVHGMQWCRDKGFGGNGGWGDILGRRSDDRGKVGDRRYDDYERSGSYERSHQEFHYRHDRECRIRAAERPLDLQWQIRVRSECKQRHDDWHHRAGRRHD